MSLAVFAAALAAPAQAQSRQELQILAELRMLAESVQRLQASLGTMAEQLKQTRSAQEAQHTDVVKRFADQRVQVEAVAAVVRTLNERVNENVTGVLSARQELKLFRETLVQQQKALNEILTLLQTPPDPNAMPDTPAAPRPAPGGEVPPSPDAVFQAGWNFYTSTQLDLAVRQFEDAIAKYPDSPQVPRALNAMGDAYYKLGKFAEAVAAHTRVIKEHPSSDEVPDAYYRQAMGFERLKQRDDAIRAYQTVRSQFPASSSAPLAAQALRRMGVIK
jgi:TolA-binding protein